MSVIVFVHFFIIFSFAIVVSILPYFKKKQYINKKCKNWGVWVSFSSTFYSRLFCTKVLMVAFLKLITVYIVLLYNFFAKEYWQNSSS